MAVINMIMNIVFFLWRCDPTRALVSSLLRFLDHMHGRTTVSRTPPDLWLDHRRGNEHI